MMGLMDVALKEWSSVIDALERGRQILLLRKGGIVEAARGGFQTRHPEFLLFPSHEHQHNESLKPEFQKPADPGKPGWLPIRVLAKITDVLPAPPTLESIRAIDDAHIWNERFLRMRYEYRPDLPLVVLLVRAWRLDPPVRIPDRTSYTGCKSWVNLSENINVSSAVPVLSEEAYQSKRAQLLAKLQT
jgi:hypothetical protein